MFTAYSGFSNNFHEFTHFSPLSIPWENTVLVARRKHHSTHGKFSKRSGQQHVDKQVFGNMKIQKETGMWEVSLLQQSMLHICKLKQGSTTLESGRVKVLWDLTRSAQGFEDQRSQGESLSLHTFLKDISKENGVFTCQWEIAYTSIRTENCYVIKMKNKWMQFYQNSARWPK